MSRTNDVNIAMQYAKSGVDGVHLMDSHKATIGWVVNTLAAEVERLEGALEMGQMNCDDAYEDLRAERELARQRAEAAEARVRELEAQYACKRYHGGEGPADDTLYSCQICGLTVDISKGHCEPTIEFTMQGRSDKKAKKVSELEAQNARLRAALVRLDNIYRSELDGEDAPKRPAWLIAALNGEESST